LASSLIKNLTDKTPVALSQLCINDPADDTDGVVTVGEVLDIIAGDINVSSTGASTYNSGSIVDADINSSAAIALSKLTDSPEANATADQTNAEIKTAYEANADTNEFSDAEQTLLGNQSNTNTGDEPSSSVTVQGIVEIATIAEVNTGTDATRAVSPDSLEGSALQIKSDSSESNATADQTGAEIKTAYEGESDTNAYTDSEVTIVGNTSNTNTGDEPDANLTTKGIVELATIAEVDTGTDATRAVTPDSLEGSALQIKVDAISGTNTGDEVAASATVSGIAELATIAEVDTGTDTVRTITPAGLAGSALQTKADSVETNADVTDTTNVNAAAATIVGTVATGVWEGTAIADGFIASTFLKNLLEDTSPQLGADLDANGFDINLDAGFLLSFDTGTQAQKIVGDAGGLTHTVPNADTHEFVVDATTVFTIVESGVSVTGNSAISGAFNALDMETATLSSRNGALCATIADTTGIATFVTGTVLVAPVLGTVASGVISACTSTSMVMVTPVLGTPTSVILSPPS